MIVTFDGLPDRRWEGKVLSVPSGVTETGGRQVGEVVGEISDTRLTLPPNASVNVQIIVGEKRSALSIPRAALQRDGDRRYVYVLEKGRARRRPVTVGPGASIRLGGLWLRGARARTRSAASARCDSLPAGRSS